MKLKPSEMTAEVRAMIDLRHQAEQRGHFEPLGRVLTFETAHGVIQFGTQLGEGTGPDLAWVQKPLNEYGELEREAKKSGHWEIGVLVLGAWPGLPPLRRPIQKGGQNVGCPHCQHTCEICAGTGIKQCEGLDCGGRGWVWGSWIDCPGPGCRGETGAFKDGCQSCADSPIRGQIREQVPCAMCKGSRVMTCSGCRGTKKRSTGHVGGSLDWRMPPCKTCGGTGWKSELVAQDVNKFTNAVLCYVIPYSRNIARSKKTRMPYYMALGPIHSFTIKDYSTMRPRVFDVSADSAGDFLMLLVPASARQKPQKAYLVGGVVRERGGERGAA